MTENLMQNRKPLLLISSRKGRSEKKLVRASLNNPSLDGRGRGG